MGRSREKGTRGRRTGAMDGEKGPEAGDGGRGTEAVDGVTERGPWTLEGEQGP